MPPIRDQAIVLRTWDYSETSQTASLFTREHGSVRGLAKGSRRDRSSFSGGLEPLTLGELGASIKPNSELATLTDWDLREVFRAARSDLLAHNGAMMIADVLHHALRPMDPHQGLFDAALASLRAMNEPVATPGAVLRFQWALCRELGFAPRLELPDALRATEIVHFSPSQGAVVASQPPADAWRVRVETVRLLRNLAEPGGTQPEARVASLRAILRASRLLAAYHRHLLERDLTTLSPYFEQAQRTLTPGTRGG